MVFKDPSVFGEYLIPRVDFSEVNFFTKMIGGMGCTFTHIIRNFPHKMNMAKVFQLNCHKAEDATGISVGKHPDSIYLIQETYYTTTGKPGVRKKSNYFAKAKSRAGIYTSALQSCKFVPMYDFICDDIATGTIEGGSLSEPLIICSVYLDIEKPTILPKFRELVEFCKTNNRKLVCGIDCNAHSSLWGSPDTNSRGEVQEEFIFEYGLYVENVGTTPTWRRGASKSIIDITLTLNVTDVNQWRVTNEVSFSDHKLISYTVGVPVSETVMTRNFAKADWDVFASVVQSKLEAPPTQWSKQTIENSILNFNSTLEIALDKACPKHPARKRDKLMWWNQECQVAKKHYIALERKMLRTPGEISEEIRLEVKSSRRAFKKAVRRAKIESFRALVRDTATTPAMARLNKIIDRKESAALGFLRRRNGTMCSSTNETLNILLREHFPGSKLTGEHPDDVPISGEEGTQPVRPLPWIDNFRVKKAIAQFSPHKTAGPDDFKPLILQHLPDVAISFLRHFYTACIRLNYTPKLWCHSMVSFMPKPMKPSYLEPRSFRPISLCCFLFKGLERLAVWHVEDTTLGSYPLHPRQHAFRKNHSTEHALTESVDTIEQALFRGQMAIGIYMDIRGAFDNISTEAIVGSLRQRGIDGDIISWYEYYLRHRTCETSLGASKVKAKLERGAPQGGCASPTLGWNIPYDNLLISFDKGVHRFGFADDGKFVILGVDFDTMFKIAQKAIKTAEIWARETGVQFCTNKTQVLFFSRGIWRPEQKLKLYGNELPWSRETKYLGVTIDDKLTFRKHVLNRVRAAKRKLMILRNVLENTWGPKPAIAKWVYTGIVRPALTYGCIVWARQVNDPFIQRQLNSLQRLALMQIANVRRSTPTAALELLYNIPPLDIYIWETALKAGARIGIDPKWIPKGTTFKDKDKGHQHLLVEQLKLHGAYRLKLDDRLTSTTWELNYSVRIGNGKDITRRDFTCYTDGSKMNGRSGAGAVILKGDNDVFCMTSFSLGSCTVFLAEVISIISVAQILVQNGVSHKTINIMVDSQAALKALENTDLYSDCVRQARHVLNILGRDNSLTLRWIEAHKGWYWNEIADRLAKKGSTPACKRKWQEPLPNKRSVFADIEQITLKKWVHRWKNSPDYRQSKYFLSKPHKSKSDILLQFPRDTVSKIVRFVTGHAFLKRHNSVIFYKTNNPPGDISCRLCDDVDSEETPHHIITECERLDLWRSTTLGDYTLPEYSEWQPQCLRKFLSSKIIILLEADDN